MRIAFITVGDTKRLTGGYLYNARIIEGLRELGVEVEEIVASGAAPEEQAAAAPGFDLDPRRFDVVVVDALARIACAPHLDVWREKTPVVAMVHELPGIASPEFAEREQRFEGPLLRSDRLVSVSNHGKSILENLGVSARRISVVPPGTDHLINEGMRNPRREDETVRALCVAQWIPRKGILELVRAWNSRERPDARLMLIGETDADRQYAAAVRSAIAEAPGSSITVTGPVDDEELLRAYAEADFFALPSRYEGYGLVYAEALTSGLPVVACRVGPVPELVGEDAAFLVPVGDTGALCGALDRLTLDASLRAWMSEAARRRARTLPRWDEAVSGFHGALRAALAARTRRVL